MQKSMRHPFIREDDITSSESVYNTLHLIISYDSFESVPQCVSFVQSSSLTPGAADGYHLILKSLSIRKPPNALKLHPCKCIIQSGLECLLTY